MSRKIADLLIKIGADNYEFQQKAREAERGLESMGKRLDNIGKQMSLKVTAPLVALGVVAIKNYDEQIQRDAKLLRALNGREDVQQRLLKQASELQNKSTLGDEAIIAQQSYFATLKLGEGQIKNATEAAVEMSYAFKDQGMNIETASKYLGQMYSGSVGRLGKLIPQLKEFTAEQLKNGEGVKYILENYRGFAETAANEGLGFAKQIKNQWGDLMEEFGKIMLPALQKVGEFVKGVITYLQALTPETKKVIVVIAGIAAAIGPLAFTIGGVIKILPTLAVGFTAILSPIGLAIAAITTLAAAFAYLKRKEGEYYAAQAQSLAKNFSEKELNQKDAEIQKQLDNNYAKIAELSKEAFVFRDIPQISRLKKENKELLSTEIDIANALRIKREETQAAAKADADAKVIIEELERALKNNNTELKLSGGLINDLKNQIEALEKKKLLPKSTIEDIAEANTEIAKLNKELQRLSNITTAKPDLTPVLTGNEQLKFTPPKITADSIDPSDVDSALAETSNRYAEAITEFQNNLNALCENFSVEGFAMIGETIGGAISGALDGNDILQTFGNFFASMLQQLGTMLIAYATSMLIFKVAIEEAFANPWVALAAGIAMIATSAIIKGSIEEKASKASKNVPKLAEGGLAYGATYAMVGDNRNAHIDPEVIAPLSKLKNLMGGGSQNVHIAGEFKVRGNDLALTLDRNNTRITLIKG